MRFVKSSFWLLLLFVFYNTLIIRFSQPSFIEAYTVLGSLMFLFLYRLYGVISYRRNENCLLSVEGGILSLLCLLLYLKSFLFNSIFELFSSHFVICIIGAIILLTTYDKRDYQVSEKRINLFESLFVCLAVIFLAIQCIQGLRQVFYFGHSIKLSTRYVRGFFYNSPTLANYLISLFPFTLAAFYSRYGGNNRRSKLIKLLLLPLIVVFTIVIVFTYSRTVWIATGVCIIIFLSVHYKKNFKRIKLSTPKILIVCCCVIIAIFSLYRFKPNSVKGRLLIYKISATLVKDNPWEGVGSGRFTARYNQYQEEYFEKSLSRNELQYLADNTFNAFNEYIQFMAENGLPCFFILFLVTLFFIIHFIRFLRSGSENYFLLAAYTSVICTLLCSMTSYPYHDEIISCNSFLFLFIIYATDTSICHKFILRGIFRLFLLIGSLFLIGIILPYGITYYKALTYWTQLEDNNSDASWSMIEQGYKKVYPYLKYNGKFLYNYGVELSIYGEPVKSIKILDEASNYYYSSYLFMVQGDNYSQMKDFPNAIKSYLNASYIVPSQFFPKFKLMNAYLAINNRETAMKYAQMIVKMKVKIKSDFVHNMKKQALHTLDSLKSIKLNP